MRVTGSVALEDEEFATVVQGAAVGLIGSFLLVIVWLFLATQTWRLVVPILATLVLGLVLTTGFAAIAVGTLNLISVAFAILFVGIAVDFAIQFSVRLRERRRAHPMMHEAIRETGRRAGAQILVASLATASGFLAFTPTDFVGVAQLGTIAGGGMIIAFVCTLTFLPAMIDFCHPPEEPREVGPPPVRRIDPFIVRIHRPILAVFVVLALGGAILTPFIPFDGDPLHTKNQHTEAVETLYDLMGDPLTNPYTIETIKPSLADAAAAAARLAHLPMVKDVLTLDSFVPTDQPAKLALIQDAAGILGVTLAAPSSPPPFDAAALRTATVKLKTALDGVAPSLSANDPLRAIDGDLARLATAPDATLLAANDALTKYLPMQLDHLRLALTATPVTLADVPADIKRDWVLPDGRARLQVLPAASVRNTRAIRQFVAGITKALPDATRLCRLDRGKHGHHHRRLPHRRAGRHLRHRHHPHRRSAPHARCGTRAERPHRLRAADCASAPLLRPQPEFREHHRPAPAAGSRRLLQHLLRHELARREHALSRIGNRPRRHVLLAHHRHRLRLAGPLGAPRHGEHGHLAAHEPVLHGHYDIAVRAGAACGGASSACSAWRI